MSPEVRMQDIKSFNFSQKFCIKTNIATKNVGRELKLEKLFATLLRLLKQKF